jgi:excinuclease ABC subunit C
MIPQEIEDIELIEKLLSDKAQKKIEFKIPQKGEKLRFIEMANNNARITLDNRTKEKEDIVLKIKEILNLDKLPRKIECFDISNISGEYMVAGMCVAKDRSY